MGLDISHNTWHGAYSSFMRWRTKIAEVAGFPPLELMEGFYSDDQYSLLDYAYPQGDELEMLAFRRIKERLPIKWDLFEKHPLFSLLTHSDCDGEINYGDCKKISDALELLLPKLEGLDAGGHIGSYVEKTKEFIHGCRDAYSKKEKIKFG